MTKQIAKFTEKQKKDLEKAKKIQESKDFNFNELKKKVMERRQLQDQMTQRRSRQQTKR